MADQNGTDLPVDKVDALVIGAGPAGLMACETLAGAGRRVVLTDAMPSVARKFLMAGKSGLNLTKAEPLDQFINAYGPLPEQMTAALRAFGPDEVVAWAEGLGIGLFTGTTKRVFPRVMKASPLLRAWMTRLGEQGVDLRTRHRWTGWHGANTVLETPEGRIELAADTVILALGGASWRRLGSTGAWANILTSRKGTSRKGTTTMIVVTWMKVVVGTDI